MIAHIGGLEEMLGHIILNKNNEKGAQRVEDRLYMEAAKSIGQSINPKQISDVLKGMIGSLNLLKTLDEINRELNSILQSAGKLTARPKLPTSPPALRV